MRRRGEVIVEHGHQEHKVGLHFVVGLRHHDHSDQNLLKLRLLLRLRVDQVEGQELLEGELRAEGVPLMQEKDRSLGRDLRL